VSWRSCIKSTLILQDIFNNVMDSNQIKDVKQWQVIYTRHKWEKKVDLLLKQQGITSYCPIKTVKSQWADRIKTVEFPLFNSYVFVKVNLKDELMVRQTYGVINFIYFMGKPATIRESEIEKIRELLIQNPDAELISLNEISIGDQVNIKNGLLCNQQGRIIKINGKTVLMAFENLACALVAKVSLKDLALSF